MTRMTGISNAVAYDADSINNKSGDDWQLAKTP
jgi:hypothetical protein